jgi:hypothetical protein
VRGPGRPWLPTCGGTARAAQVAMAMGAALSGVGARPDPRMEAVGKSLPIARVPDMVRKMVPNYGT